MIVERKLKDPISVPVYPTNSDAVKETNAVKDFVLRKGILAGARNPLGFLWYPAPDSHKQIAFAREQYSSVELKCASFETLAKRYKNSRRIDQHVNISR